MTDNDRCAECGRTLLHSNNVLVCCWRHCPAYGQEVEPEPEPIYTNRWAEVREAIRRAPSPSHTPTLQTTTTATHNRPNPIP